MLTAQPRKKPSCDMASGCRIKALPMVRLPAGRTVIE